MVNFWQSTGGTSQLRGTDGLRVLEITGCVRDARWHFREKLSFLTAHEGGEPVAEMIHDSLEDLSDAEWNDRACLVTTMEILSGAFGSQWCSVGLVLVEAQDGRSYRRVGVFHATSKTTEDECARWLEKSRHDRILVI